MPEKRYYIDACIWRDYYERRGNAFHPIGRWAFRFLMKIKKEKAEVIYSDVVEHELRKSYSPYDIKLLLKSIHGENLLRRIKAHRKQIHEAALLQKSLHISFGDCLHAVLARDSFAMMITRDRHFEKLKHIVECRKPEELL